MKFPIFACVIVMLAGGLGHSQETYLGPAVVAVDLSAPLSCQVGFERFYDVTVTPSADAASFGINDPSLGSVRVISSDGTSVRLGVKPFQRGDLKLIARSGSASGPIIASRDIDEFTIEFAGATGLVISNETRIGSTYMIMRPFVEHQKFLITMFASPSTFKGGSRQFTINTSDAQSSLGEGPFQQISDAATYETIGRFDFTIETPPGTTDACIAIEGAQVNSPEIANTYVNAYNPKVCDVLSYKSLKFMRADDAKEDEVKPEKPLEDPSGDNPEEWLSRSWPLYTAAACTEEGPVPIILEGMPTAADHDDCNIDHHLHVNPPPPPSTRIDNPRRALFAANLEDSDCKPCDTCSAVSPTMDTGTIPGLYTTEVRMCAEGGGGSLGSASGGLFYIAKLDAHGRKGGTTDKFPDYAEALPRRPGTVWEPVIQMDSGGDQSVAGCSLYGIIGMPCNPTNVWTFTAVARDPETNEDIPEGVTISWSDVGGMEVLEEKNGQPWKIKATYRAVGRFFPTLTVTDSSGHVATASIHSIVLEAQPGDNVAMKNGDVDAEIRRGTPFHVTDHVGGIGVDARFRVVSGGSPADPESPRGRISLDGYPQNEYWVTSGDVADLPQVAQIPDNAPQQLWLQGYQAPSRAKDDLTLRCEGQALEEICENCATFQGQFVTDTWEVTDEEKFSGFIIEPMSKSDVDGEVFIAEDVGTRSEPTPEVELSVAYAVIDSDGSMRVELTGRVYDALSGLMDAGEKVQSVTFTVNGEPMGTTFLSPSSGGGDPIFEPERFDVAFNRTMVFPNPGNHTFIIRAESAPNAAGYSGWAEVGVSAQLEPIEQPSSGGGPLPGLLNSRMTMQFLNAPTPTARDSVGIIFRNRNFPGFASEASNAPDSLVFDGFILSPSRRFSLEPLKITLLDRPAFSPDAIDTFRTVIALGSPAVSGIDIWTETAPNSLRFTNERGATPFVINAHDDAPPPGATQVLFVPVVGHVQQGATSMPGSFEPVTARLRGVFEEGSISIRLADGSGDGKMVQFPDGEFLTAYDDDKGRPDVRVFTQSSGGIAVAGNVLGGSKLEVLVEDEDDFPEANDENGYDEDLTDEETDLPPLVKTTTRQQMIDAYHLLYGDLGKKMLERFEAKAGNTVDVGFVFFIWDFRVHGWVDGDIQIVVRENQDPVSAANNLWSAINDVFPKVRERIPLEDLALWEFAHKNVAKAAIKDAVWVTELYMGALGVVGGPFGIGADLAILIDEANQVDREALKLGNEMVHPAQAGIFSVVSRATGQVLLKLTPELRAVLKEAKALKFFRERYAKVLEQATEGEARLMVKSRMLAAPLKHRELRAAMGKPPAGLFKATAHHDLPWKFRRWFAEHGVDCNDPNFGRWVKGGKGAPHGKWSRAFNDEWEAFIRAEPPTGYSAQDIIDKMTQMRNSPLYPSR